MTFRQPEWRASVIIITSNHSQFVIIVTSLVESTNHKTQLKMIILSQGKNNKTSPCNEECTTMGGIIRSGQDSSNAD